MHFPKISPQKYWLIGSTIGFVLGLWLPFVLMLNYYPLFRFGMFAEPIRQAAQAEYFVVCSAGQRLQPEALQLNQEYYDYIVRHYYYRQQGVALLRIFQSQYPQQTTDWVLYRLSVNQPDTLDIITLKQAE
ncbi:hypothetical protein [Eisenibacter elegans]|uniref:hypothetical protein n=1 Tax=Eisenibacter elegans TaxID=997 RepID=UPI00041EED8E|nr:hypothetical protein [Eisenibacter elegans]